MIAIAVTLSAVSVVLLAINQWLDQRRLSAFIEAQAQINRHQFEFNREQLELNRRRPW